MDYKIVTKDEAKIRNSGDQYIILGEDETDVPTEEEFTAAVSLFQKRIEQYPIRSSFRDEPAICLLDDLDDDPSYLLGAELSNEEAVSIKTIELISEVMSELSPKFKFFLVFEYNYLGFDFSCFFENDTVSFCFNDTISQEKFGLS